ncbi:SiaB family protein kinase [Marinigracilibium pacificum]|uniref:Histidine kinase/HSP90-like ATPase domain-containing protein n=1 Tax=Marinigracilibium pacificum TaxID=2729599 RepID=A0A848IVU6_9BACT|nr:SiaB family protein kinase [Marinigracilibium pacificum]NMM48613.1 hypothetical protein [Marinigracilibium pacificum]
MKYVYDLHKTMLDHHLILVYEGEFTQEITKSVLSMAERNMDAIGEDSSIKRKVFNVMVEALQNIVKHSENTERDGSGRQNAIFMLGKSNNEYLITSGNACKISDVDEIKVKLEKINSLDKDGLKQLYKDTIKSGSLSEKGGAGLGFVDMARKSGKPLNFDFIKIDDEHSFFSLQTLISRV